MNCMYSYSGGSICDPGCYSVNLENWYYELNNPSVTCFNYSVAVNEQCMTTTDLYLLFSVNLDECYINTLDMLNILNSTSPPYYRIYDETAYNQLVGIEFNVEGPYDLITMCVNGINGQITPGVIRIRDNMNECSLTIADSIDFCGICEVGVFTTCFCHETESSCLDGVRPRSHLECTWDFVNQWCEASLSDDCLATLPACACFGTEDECLEAQFEEGRNCEWNSNINKCAPTDCIGCSCYEIRQDCINTDYYECLWDTVNNVCIEAPCTDRCSCFDTEAECLGAIIDHSLDCMWIGECVNAFTTTDSEEQTTVWAKPPTARWVIPQVPAPASGWVHRGGKTRRNRNGKNRGNRRGKGRGKGRRHA